MAIMQGYGMGCTLGCDPEFFFEKDGGVIGSERVLDGEAGEKWKKAHAPKKSAYGKHFVMDGVQIEMNPSPHTCRANLSNEMKAAFRALRDHLKTLDGVKPTFNAVVTVPQVEMDALSEKSKQFGCAPSKNFYDAGATIKADAATSLVRAAGGHIHIGTPYHRDKIESLAPVCDVLLGALCVLIDRNPHAAERRKVYGRAGEFRLPKHGFEYRTLSNFWLQSYQLMSLVMGMARQAHGAWWWSEQGKLGVRSTHYYVGQSYSDIVGEILLKGLDMGMVTECINTNEVGLAWKIWESHTKPFIIKAYGIGPDTTLHAGNVEAFEFFARSVQEREKEPGYGLKYWFPQDPFEHWCNKPEGHDTGWEAYVNGTIVRVMKGEMVAPGDPEFQRKMAEIKVAQEARLAKVREERLAVVGPVIAGTAATTVANNGVTYTVQSF